MKNSLAALLADDKARVVVHDLGLGRYWFFGVMLDLPEGTFRYTHDQPFRTRSEAGLAGEALRDKAKEQVNR